MESEKYNLPRLNQEEIENVSRPITSTEIETVIKKLLTNKSLEPDCFTGDVYQTVKEYHHSQTLKKKMDGTLPNSFMKPALP